MAYRDELSAARMRINQLEGELAAYRQAQHAGRKWHQQQQSQALLEAQNAMAAAQRRIAQLEHECSTFESQSYDNAALRQHITQLNAELAAARGEKMDKTMMTLREYNTQWPARAKGDPMGVSCPECANENVEVEMMEGGLQLMKLGKAAACPRCGYSGYKRDV